MKSETEIRILFSQYRHGILTPEETRERLAAYPQEDVDAVRTALVREHYQQVLSERVEVVHVG